ncbi:MAG: hypothetical protein JWQ49_1385, partial [Edaphobacter sp.]|nr:hypothetical protein [Edaphobacter sp.]
KERLRIKETVPFKSALLADYFTARRAEVLNHNSPHPGAAIHAEQSLTIRNDKRTSSQLCSPKSLVANHAGPSMTGSARYHQRRPDLVFRREVDWPYRSTRCRTTGMLDGKRMFGLLDGSDPSGGGPTAGRGPLGSSARGNAEPGSTVRCNSI